MFGGRHVSHISSPAYLSSPSFVVLVHLLYLERSRGGGIVYHFSVDGVFLGGALSIF